MRQAFKTYCATAELAGATEPNLLFDLRVKNRGVVHKDSGGTTVAFPGDTRR